MGFHHGRRSCGPWRPCVLILLFYEPLLELIVPGSHGPSVLQDLNARSGCRKVVSLGREAITRSDVIPEHGSEGIVDEAAYFLQECAN